MILAELVDGSPVGVERRFRRKRSGRSSFRGPRPADPDGRAVNQFREHHQETPGAAMSSTTRAKAPKSTGLGMTVIPRLRASHENSAA